MKCISKLFALLLLGVVAFGFVLTGTNGAAGIEIFGIFNRTTADPLSLLFQILFWLFFISPPLIVVLLFLIWCELKNRNKMK